MSMWSRLFGKDPKELFLNYNPHESHWRVVSWNFDLELPEQRLWVIEIDGEKKNIIQWERNSHEEVRFFNGDELLRKRRIPPHDQELKTLMNLAIHSTLKFSLEENHKFMITPVAGATTLDMQNESKALLWIQASFGTLTRALDKIENDHSMILTAAFFSGKVPESDEEVLRLIAFNLDIFFYFRADSSLQIVIFDDKAMGHGKSQTPSFQQIIKVTKPQFYDEIVKLVHRLAIVGEIK
jgi:hypothetical protein